MLKYSLVKFTDDYVIVDPTDDLDPMDMKKEQLEGKANDLDRSLGDYGWYNRYINSYDFYLEDLYRSIALSSLHYYSSDYSNAFDKLNRALCI